MSEPSAASSARRTRLLIRDGFQARRLFGQLRAAARVENFRGLRLDEDGLVGGTVKQAIVAERLQHRSRGIGPARRNGDDACFDIAVVVACELGQSGVEVGGAGWSHAPESGREGERGQQEEAQHESGHQDLLPNGLAGPPVIPGRPTAAPE